MTEPLRLKHGDRVRFGLHNYFVFLAPGETEDEQINWEYANKEAVDNNVQEIEAKSHIESQELKARLKELEGLVNEKEDLQRQMQLKIEQMEKEHQERMEKLRGKYKKLIDGAGTEEQARL